MGATAIGTGINAHPDYARAGLRASARHHRRSPLVTAPNLVEATQDTGAFVQLSGVLKRMAVKLSKICNDLRLLSSGPRAGLGEINLPAMQAGLQHHAGQGEPGDPGGGQPGRLRGDRQRRHGHDGRRGRASCSSTPSSRSSPTACSRASCICANGCCTLGERCVPASPPTASGLRRMVENSIGIVTALNPYIGYENASQIAQAGARERRLGLRARAGVRLDDAREQLDEVVNRRSRKAATDAAPSRRR